MSHKKPPKRAFSNNSTMERKNEPQPQWSQNSYSLKEIAETMQPGQVIQCAPRTTFLRPESPFPVNMMLPIVLMDKKASRNLLARNVVYDKGLYRYAETNDSIIIPEEYGGSFLRLNTRTMKDPTNHSSIESLVKNNVKSFINVTQVHAFGLNGNKNTPEYARLEYAPGNVFIIDDVITGYPKLMASTPRSNIHTEVKCAKCRDERSLEIVIPTGQGGQFIDAMPTNINVGGRLSISSRYLIEREQFPIVVRYIRGSRPRLLDFSGLFTLLDTFVEESVIGCVIDKDELTMIELPVDSPLLFHKATNDLLANIKVGKAMDLWELKGRDFSKDIKYKFKFAQKSTRRQQDSTGSESEITPSNSASFRHGVNSTHFYI